MEGQKQTYWWKESGTDLFESVFAYVKFLEDHQPYIYQDDKRNAKLYGNTDLFGLAPRAHSHNRLDRLKLNIVKSMCDTATSKIAKDRIKPTFLTSGGDWSIQRKAKQLEKFAMGQLLSTGFYRKSFDAFLDATVLGTGCLKIYRDGEEICIDRVLKSELRVDQQDAFYGEPRTLFQVKYIAREVLIDMFPDKESEIRQAQNSDSEDNKGIQYGETQADMVKVVEGWHLRSSCDSDDGRHVIACSTATLFEEEFCEDRFPFVFLHWSRAMSGFWGIGIADILTGIQIEINKLLKENQDIFHLMDIPQIFVEAGSKIVTSHFDNQIGTVHTFTGTPPQQWKAGSVSMERFNYLQFLIRQAYEIVGISQLSSSSKKPEGLDSGKAIRTFHDIETERFAQVTRGWEQFTIDTVKQLLDLAREIDETTPGGYKVLVSSNRYAQEIQWKDVNLKADQYILQVYPTNLLPETPEGKLQYVQELMQAGLYGPEEGRKLLDFPDTESINQYLNADQEDIELLIEQFIEKGEYHPPEPFQNLQLGIGMVQKAYLRSKIDGVPEERLELFRRWVSEAAAMLAPPEPQIAPEMVGMDGLGAQGPLPQANPEPSPTNDLIPNVPGVPTTQ